jgi:pSer/pThr/pTyr-binding forkhead associated (FHA) protein
MLSQSTGNPTVPALSNHSSEDEASDSPGGELELQNPGAREGSEIQVAVQRCDSRLETETYVFRRPVVLIGRSPDADLVLPDRRLGEMQIYLQQLAGRWAAVDLAAMSGDCPEQTRRPIHWFDLDDQLQVGPYVIGRIGQQGQLPGSLVRLPATSGQTVAIIQFLNGRGRAGGQFSQTITRPITLLGKSRRCDLRLNDQSVADVHAGLIRIDDAVWVADLRRDQSVLVDGRPVWWSRLEDGAILQVGKFRFLMQSGGSRGRVDQWFEDANYGPAALAPPQPSGLSLESVMAFMRHVADMQNRFIECSQQQMQQQMQMMCTFLQILERWQSSPESIRSDGQRLIGLKHDLEQLKGKGRRKRPKRARRKISGDVVSSKDEPSASDGQLPPALSRPQVTGNPPGRNPAHELGIECACCPSPDTSNSQLRLTDRMANSAAQEESLGGWFRKLLS